MINAGNRIRLVNIEITSVVEVRIPNAIVPPKEENAKMMKPANKTMDV
jgi:hypothetical protein